MNGQQQRNALTAVERSLAALGKGDAHAALRAISKATQLDQVGIYAAVSEAVRHAVLDLESGGTISPDHWDLIEASVGPGPLVALVQHLRAP